MKKYHATKKTKPRLFDDIVVLGQPRPQKTTKIMASSPYRQ